MGVVVTHPYYNSFYGKASIISFMITSRYSMFMSHSVP